MKGEAVVLADVSSLADEEHVVIWAKIADSGTLIARLMRACDIFVFTDGDDAVMDEGWTKGPHLPGLVMGEVSEPFFPS